ncbi:MAG: KpsF/GutQ family sugar-phosphate isomerase [Candidatus Neomarinimicrobiota bacterium]|nr:KpsF/GutQ family sugar-phosphate isomerase [Candidatus Neomarinimicrobiota bacterium]
MPNKSAINLIQAEIAALNSLLKTIDNSFDNVVDLIVNCSGKIIVIGIGKSGHVGNKMAATFASLGTPAFFLHAGDAVHGDLGMISNEDVCILVSYSGNSTELVEILKSIKRIGSKTISITGKPESTLAKRTDLHLDIGVRAEADPLGLAPTSSSTATLVLGDALAIAVMETRGFKEKDFADRHPGGILGKKLLLTVDQIFHEGDAIPLINKNNKIQEALLIISEKGLGFTGVIDDKGVLIGIITDGDIRRGLEKGHDDLFNLNVESIMTTTPRSISTNTLAIKALEIMEEHSITSLFVHNHNNPDELKGVIHIHDILNSGI